jgi:hypothetical protein
MTNRIDDRIGPLQAIKERVDARLTSLSGSHSHSADVRFEQLDAAILEQRRRDHSARRRFEEKLDQITCMPPVNRTHK